MPTVNLPNLSDIGYLVEGVVEQDPLSDRYLIKVEGANGTCSQFDVQTTLAKYVGKEVRFTLVTFEVLQQLAELVQKGAAKTT